MDEQLLVEQQERASFRSEEDRKEENVAGSELTHMSVRSKLRRVAPVAVHLALTRSGYCLCRRVNHNRAARYDYYVARYEVVETMRDVERGGLSLREAQRGTQAAML